MSMQLTLKALSDINTAVEEISKVQNVTIHQIVVGSHTVFLDRIQIGNDGQEYVIVGITNKEVTHNNKPVYR